MRMFIPSKGRSATITTPAAFAGMDLTVVVHDNEEADAYRRQLPDTPVVVSGVTADAYGLTRQREWIVRTLATPGEWLCFADDNIRRMTALPEPWYGLESVPVKMGDAKTWRTLYGTTCTAERFQAIASETCRRADQQGARLAGFCAVGNYFFRAKKWRSVGYVIGKIYLVKNAGLTYDHTITMEDFRNTAQHLLEDGSVVINDFAWAEAGHYEAGGMGRYRDRVEYRLTDCRRLMALYPGLFRYRQHPGFVRNTDLALRLHSIGQVAAWRHGMGR